MQRQQRSWMLRSWKGLSGIYWPLNPGRRVKTAQPVNQLRKTRQQDPRKNPQRQGRLLTVDKNFSAKIFKIDDKQAGCGFISSQFSCISAELIAHGPGLYLYLYYSEWTWLLQRGRCGNRHEWHSVVSGTSQWSTSECIYSHGKEP